MASLNGITWSGKPKFRVRVPSYNSTDLIIDLNSGHIWRLNYENISAAIGTFLVQNVPSGTGIVSSFLLGIIQGPNSGSHYLNWSAMSNVKWAGGASGRPTITTTDNAVDYLSFTTWDNGTTWYGTIVGQDIK
jgi:hypothetical protein